MTKKLLQIKLNCHYVIMNQKTNIIDNTHLNFFEIASVSFKFYS